MEEVPFDWDIARATRQLHPLCQHSPTGQFAPAEEPAQTE
jgi:hypothetical protein